MLEGFLLGIIVFGSLVAGMFFLKFWRQTRHLLFLAFGLAFLIEGVNRACFMLIEQPNRGHVVIYLVRLLCYLLILGAIIHKNTRRG
jgi:uncharacterized membrane protein HdeD (DUF308 family)